MAFYLPAYLRYHYATLYLAALLPVPACHLPFYTFAPPTPVQYLPLPAYVNTTCYAHPAARYLLPGRAYLPLSYAAYWYRMMVYTC